MKFSNLAQPQMHTDKCNPQTKCETAIVDVLTNQEMRHEKYNALKISCGWALNSGIYDIATPYVVAVNPRLRHRTDAKIVVELCQRGINYPKNFAPRCARSTREKRPSFRSTPEFSTPKRRLECARSESSGYHLASDKTSCLFCCYVSVYKCYLR